MESEAAIFARLFLCAYREASHDAEQTKSKWSERRVWTLHMLERDAGVLTVASKAWAKEAVGADRFKLFPEHRKIDLMIVKTPDASGEWWESTPSLLVEHENADDVEVEAWNLASMRARLKVLVFYYRDETDRSAKLSRISRVVGIAEREHVPNGSYLLLAAPSRFGEGVQWITSE